MTDRDPQTFSGVSQGPSTDRHNEPVVDPTQNVLDLVQAAVLRQDDLRDQDREWRDKLDALRADYEDKLRKAETARIDAIREVDVGNVQRAAEVQAGVASQLAGQLAATATAFESRLAATIEPIQKRLDDLTRSQYEAVGQKTQVVETRDSGSEIRQQTSFVVYIVLGLITLLMTGIALYGLATRNSGKAVSTTRPPFLSAVAAEHMTGVPLLRRVGVRSDTWR